ncbi:unnamed protein product [Amoebophrya sp. A25]|nr:unnamed protein product [Amoebophrya sp. A25]|eukprot:GSA25T00011293001.1
MAGKMMDDESLMSDTSRTTVPSTPSSNGSDDVDFSFAISTPELKIKEVMRSPSSGYMMQRAPCAARKKNAEHDHGGPFFPHWFPSVAGDTNYGTRSEEMRKLPQQRQKRQKFNKTSFCVSSDEQRDRSTGFPICLPPGQIRSGRTLRGKMGYLVRLPADFDPTKKYPLLVYFHGGEAAADVSLPDEVRQKGHDPDDPWNLVNANILAFEKGCIFPLVAGGTNGFASSADDTIDLAMQEKAKCGNKRINSLSCCKALAEEQLQSKNHATEMEKDNLPLAGDCVMVAPHVKHGQLDDDNGWWQWNYPDAVENTLDLMDLLINKGVSVRLTPPTRESKRKSACRRRKDEFVDYNVFSGRETDDFETGAHTSDAGSEQFQLRHKIQIDSKRIFLTGKSAGGTGCISTALAINGYDQVGWPNKFCNYHKTLCRRWKVAGIIAVCPKFGRNDADVHQLSHRGACDSPQPSPEQHELDRWLGKPYYPPLDPESFMEVDDASRGCVLGQRKAPLNCSGNTTAATQPGSDDDDDDDHTNGVAVPKSAGGKYTSDDATRRIQFLLRLRIPVWVFVAEGDKWHAEVYADHFFDTCTAALVEKKLDSAAVEVSKATKEQMHDNIPVDYQYLRVTTEDFSGRADAKRVQEIRLASTGETRVRYTRYYKECNYGHASWLGAYQDRGIRDWFTSSARLGTGYAGEMLEDTGDWRFFQAFSCCEDEHEYQPTTKKSKSKR